MVLEQKIFYSFQCIFTFSQLSPLWEGRVPSFEQSWIPFTQGCSVPRLVEIGLVVPEKKIFKSCQFILKITQLSPIWEGRGPSFKQSWIFFTRGYVVPCLVENGPMVLKKKIFIRFNLFFLIFQLSSLWEWRGPSFEKTWIPFTQGYYVPSLVEIDQVVLENKMKMWKVYRRTDRRTDEGDQKSSLELSAQVS